MAEVITFTHYRPPARFDSLPWVSVVIYEATSSTGPWTLIDTIALVPDADPSDPSYRSFTTELGTAEDLWYRVVFVDGTGDTTQPSLPIQNLQTATTPTIGFYATTSELFRILKIRAPSPEQETAAQRCLDSAALEIDHELGIAEPYSLAPALVSEVNLERAVEHWQQQETPFGILGIGSDNGAVYSARDSWDRHALKLAPLKEQWGIA